MSPTTLYVTINQRKINTQTGEIELADETFVLEPKVLCVLHCLLASQDQMLSHEDIIATVWPNSFVEPNALQRCITRLRKALGDDEKLIIETFPKLGYRLNAAMVSVIPTKHSSVNNLLYVVCALFISAGLVLSFSYLHDSQDFKVKAITSLTFSSGLQRSPATFNNLLFYIEEKESQGQLIVQNQTTQETRVLYSAPQFYGDIAINPTGTHLLFSEVVFNNNVKCSQLSGYRIYEDKKDLLAPCENTFKHSAKWLNSKQIVFLETTKDEVNTLHSVHLSNNDFFVLDVKSDAQIANVYQFNTSAENVLISGRNTQGIEGIWAGKLVGKTFKKEYFYATSYPQLMASRPIALEGNTILQVHKNELFRYSQTSSVKRTALLQQADINLSNSLSETIILAEKSTSPWRINQRIWQSDTTFADTQVALSQFSDHSAQYQPNGSQIAYLSNRSGQDQIWIHEGDTHRQVTHDESVASFLWDLNGKHLWYISNEQLHILELGQQSPVIADKGPLKQLFQVLADGSLLAQASNTELLVKISLAHKSVEQLSERPIGWAQQLDDGTLIYATKGHGKLYYQPATNEVDMTLYPDLTIQWRFFYRNGQILTQDKNARIWAIDLASNTRKQVATFDDNALFATDIQLEPLKMLSDNFGQKTSDIVSITLE